MNDPQHQPQRRLWRFWARNWEWSLVLGCLGVVGTIIGVMALVWAYFWRA